MKDEDTETEAAEAEAAAEAGADAGAEDAADGGGGCFMRVVISPSNRKRWNSSLTPNFTKCASVRSASAAPFRQFDRNDVAYSAKDGLIDWIQRTTSSSLHSEMCFVTAESEEEEAEAAEEEEEEEEDARPELLSFESAALRRLCESGLLLAAEAESRSRLMPLRTSECLGLRYRTGRQNLDHHTQNCKECTLRAAAMALAPCKPVGLLLTSNEARNSFSLQHRKNYKACINTNTK